MAVLYKPNNILKTNELSTFESQMTRALKYDGLKTQNFFIVFNFLTPSYKSSGSHLCQYPQLCKDPYEKLSFFGTS